MGLGNMNDVRSQLSGVFGADFIIANEKAYLVEINPRYPASAELVAHARMEPLGFLKGCYREPHSLWKAKTWTTWPKVIGKAIYYAPHRVTFPESGPWDESLAHAADVWRRPDFADIPHAGDVIEAGHPVLTILTEAASEADCLHQLQSRAAELDRLFGYLSPAEETQ